MHLRRLHPDTTLSPASLKYWRSNNTPQIVQSLTPPNPKCLKVKSDGIIIDGNTRVKVLEERGYPIDSLPFEPYP